MGLHPAGRIVALEGASATGKSTLSKALAQRLHGHYLDEAYYRLRPRPPLEWSTSDDLLDIELALLEEEGRRFREAARRRERGELVIADTGFAGPLTYSTGLVELRKAPPTLLSVLLRRASRLALGSAWGVADRTILLTAPARIVAGRAARSPWKHPPQLRARHSAVARVERRLWRGPLSAALPGRVETLSTRDAVAPLVGRLAKAVQRSRDGPAAGPVEARSTLRALRKTPTARSTRG